MLLIAHNVTVGFLNQRGVVMTFLEHFWLGEPGGRVLAVIVMTVNVSLACVTWKCFLPNCGEMGGE